MKGFFQEAIQHVEQEGFFANWVLHTLKEEDKYRRAEILDPDCVLPPTIEDIMENVDD